jgi:hypothetical protein
MVYVNDTTLEVIDQRIRAASSVERAAGTVVWVDPTQLRVSVTIDGSSQAVPVKMAGQVNAVANDRVLLERYGSDWVVTEKMVDRWPADEGINLQQVAGTTVSATFATFTNSPSFPFVKRWENTRTRLSAMLSMYVTTAAAEVVAGIRFTPATGGADSEHHIVRFTLNVVSDHYTVAGEKRISGLPAGAYTAYPVWARWSGTGTLTVDDRDWLSYGAVEIGP